MNTTDPAGTSCTPGIEAAAGPATAAGRRLRVTPLADHPGLRIEGCLDRTTLAALSRALASTAGGGIRLDLGGVAFIDVGSLRAMVTAAGRLKHGHVLTLRPMSPPVRRLFELTGWGDAPRLRLEEPAGGGQAFRPGRRPARHDP